MKVNLMYRNRDFDSKWELPSQAQALSQDLGLKVLLLAMAKGDQFIYDICQKTLFQSLDSIDDIRYRQGILKDCLKNPAVIRELYKIVTETHKKKREHSWWSLSSRYMSSILSSSVNLLQLFSDSLAKLCYVVNEYGDRFESQGFKIFFTMLQTKLNDDYLSLMNSHLDELKFRSGILISAELGKGNIGVNYTLHKQPDKKDLWLKWLFAPKFTLHKRDDSGAQDLSRRRDRRINRCANVAAQAAEHLSTFFTTLQIELAFYIGCLNLYEQLAGKDEPVCFPTILALNEREHCFQGLYDISLSLILEQRVVGNSIKAAGKDIIMITGANQGGKTTFLRSIGQAQLMMQCGMFVAAEFFSANLCEGIFTHFKREEDDKMKSGKLDEELGRMSEIIDQLKPNALVLFNESFAATNEREGSEIARQIVRALLERHIKVFFVTHLYDLASSFYKEESYSTLFLRAERRADGRRTFRMVEGKPLPTSYGKDLYLEIFKQVDYSVFSADYNNDLCTDCAPKGQCRKGG